MNKLNAFCKGFIALATGDDATATSLKIWRKSESALKTEIYALNGKTVDLEDAVETAKENLEKATKNNGSVDFNRDKYISNLINSKNSLTQAEENLTQHIEKIKFLEEEYAKLQLVE